MNNPNYESLFNTAQDSKNSPFYNYFDEYEKYIKEEMDNSLLDNQTEENVFKLYYAIEKPMKEEEKLEPNNNANSIIDNPLTNCGNKFLLFNKEDTIDQNFNIQNFSQNSNHIVTNSLFKEDNSGRNNIIINESNEINESNQNNESNEKNESIESCESNKNNESNKIISSSTSKFKNWTDERKEHIIKAINPFILNKVIIIYANELIKEHKLDDENKKIKIEKLVELKRGFTANTHVEFTKSLLKKTIREIVGDSISGKCKKKEKDYNKNVIEKYYDKNPVKEIQRLFNTEFQDFFSIIRVPNNPMSARVRKIYEEVLKKKSK